MTNEIETMKPWQHGIPMFELLIDEKFFDRYNSFIQSPFMKVKKNTIAEMRHSGTLKWSIDRRACAEITSASVSNRIMSMPNVAIAQKQKGDSVVERVAFTDAHSVAKLFDRYVRGNCWWCLCEEDRESRELAKALGFKRVGVKFSTFSDIIGVYLRAVDDWHFKMRIVKLMPEEMIDIAKLDIRFGRDAFNRAVNEVQNLGAQFTNHYSNYNKSSAWSALALRGFTNDPAFIIKPAEMNDSWQKKNSEQRFLLQWTELAERVPYCLALQHLIPGAKERVRLMRLAPGGGELQRHTDQTDPDSGIAGGRIARIHIPIVTNEKVIFTVWGQDGVARDVHMEAGAAYYLDTRKPHRAINGGVNDRIHLVVDVAANTELRNLL